jgi:nucleotide-binding universal stress UspA family protein
MPNRPLVVVAVDGSYDTESTVEFAATIARRRAADLHAIQVVPRRGGLWVAPDDETRLRARLGALRPLVERHGVRLRIVTVRGKPERLVPAYAQLHAASLIVLGRTYGTSRLWRTSAVATRISRSSPVPVVVVPTRRSASEPVAPSSWTRIVAAVDFRVASAVALRTAADVARHHGAQLTILHAMNWPSGMIYSGIEASRLVRRLPVEAKAIARRLKRKASAVGAGDAEPVVVTSVPHRGIIETAAERAADLIVMGVAPRHSVEEAAFGSTLRAVLRRARIPVLVVPVVAGAYDWIDDMSVHDPFHVGSTETDVSRVAA